MFHVRSFAFLLLSVSTAPVCAQTAGPTPRAAAIHRTTLAQVLSTRGQSEVSNLVVPYPDQTLEPGQPIPEAGSSLAVITAAFGRITHDFGGMTVLANPTMCVYVAPPSEIDVTKDIPPGDAFEILVSTLDSGQWNMLVGQNGLGVADLTSDHQRDLFQTLLPAKATIQAKHLYGSTITNAEAKDVTELLPQSRIRFSKQLDINVPTRDHWTLSMRDYFEPDGPEKTLQPEREVHNPENVKRPVVTQPNMLKLGMLAWDSQGMDRTIVIAGTMSVDEVLRRVSPLLRKELIADRHLGSARFFFGGPAKYETVSNVLKAVCFGTGSMFRKVGPLYLLTENLVGAGTNYRRWDFYVESDRMKRMIPVDEATQKIGALRSPSDLNLLDDSMAYGPGEIPSTDPHSPSLSVKLEELTPGQKAAVQALVETLKMKNALLPGSVEDLDLSGTMSLVERPIVEVIIPGESEPVSFPSLSRSLSIGTVFARNHDNSQLTAMIRASQQKDADAQKAAAPKFSAVLAGFHRRAAIVHPRNTAELDALMHSMQHIGLNEMWLDVFSNGTSHLSDIEAKSKRNILQEAVLKCKGTGIHVWPVLSLLQWGQSAEPAVRDISMLGEDSLQDDQHFVQLMKPVFDQIVMMAQSGLYNLPLSKGLYVNQYSPRVIGSLANAINLAAKNDAIGGVVWTDTVVPGYDRTGGETEWIDSPEVRTGFGYNLQARLTFIRREHLDPIDIPLVQEYYNSMQFSIFADPSDNSAMLTKWNKFRSESNIALLKYLRSLAPNKPLIISLRHHEAQEGGSVASWFGSWDTINSPLPAYHNPSESAVSGQPWPSQVPARQQARMGSRVSLISIQAHREPRAGWLAAQLTKATQNPAWDGFVLDLTPQIFAGRSVGISEKDANPLALLAEDVRALHTK